MQNAETGQPVGNVDTVLTITPVDGQSAPIVVAATTDAATNKLLQSALIDLPIPGTWQVHVECTTADGKLEARFAMTAGPALPRWLSQWPWFAWPLGAVLVFVVHRWLVARRQADRFSRELALPIER